MKFVHVLFGGLGGHSAVVFGLLRARAAVEDRHHLVFFGVEPPPPANVGWCRERGVPFTSVVKRQGLDLGAWGRVARAIAQERPDCVFLHQPSLLAPVTAITRALGRRLVLIEHEPNHLKRRKDWAESALAGVLADHVVYLTDAYAAGIRRKLGPTTPRRFTIIGNSVDTELFAPATGPRPERPWTFGMHARFVATKDQATIVRAVHALRLAHPGEAFHARLAGDGPTLAPTRELARELGVTDAVEFCGLLAERELPAFLHGLDAFVLSTFGETMSTSLMQAMACGLPCIGSDVAGVNDMIRRGVDGLLFPASDTAVLVGQLRTVREDAAQARCLGEVARDRAVAQFSCEAAYARYRQLAARPR